MCKSRVISRKWFLDRRKYNIPVHEAKLLQNKRIRISLKQKIREENTQSIMNIEGRQSINYASNIWDGCK